MWFFDYFESLFGYLETEFNRLADVIDDVYLIGDYLAYPFRAVALAFYNLKLASASASDWADDVFDDATDIFDAIKSRIEAKWDILTMTAFEIYKNIEDYIKKLLENVLLTPWEYFDAIKKFIAREWTILTKSARDRFWDIKSDIEDQWDILTKSARDRFWDIKSYIEDTFAIVKETKETIWTYIENNKLGSWFDAKIVAAKNTILSYIIEGFGYLTSEWFKFLDTSWSTVKDQFSWLIDKLLDLVDEKIDDYKEKLWNLIEKFVEKI